jgi:hypothetical protein
MSVPVEEPGQEAAMGVGDPGLGPGKIVKRAEKLPPKAVGEPLGG